MFFNPLPRGNPHPEEQNEVVGPLKLSDDEKPLDLRSVAGSLGYSVFFPKERPPDLDRIVLEIPCEVMSNISRPSSKSQIRSGDG